MTKAVPYGKVGGGLLATLILLSILQSTCITSQKNVLPSLVEGGPPGLLAEELPLIVAPPGGCGGSVC